MGAPRRREREVVAASMLTFIRGNNVRCTFRSVNLKRVVRRNAMAEVGRKSWNRGCIPIVVFGRDKARISISHSPRRSSLIPRILTPPPLDDSYYFIPTFRFRPSPLHERLTKRYLFPNRSNSPYNREIQPFSIRLEIDRPTSSILYPS